MQAYAKKEVVKSLMKELAIADASEIIRDSLVTEILCKVSDFSDEVKHFEEKYGKQFDEFNEEYETNEEDFEKYDDLMEWEFAQQG
ncbi:MAG TPA: hypothetical protein VK469_01625, partial [Candidatus Kapabacteria bacterium]|nr:hypothetical protein [Candidatus Kapabacteria bacterium]